VAFLSLPGRALRDANAAKEPRNYSHRDHLVCPGHRREHSDLHVAKAVLLDALSVNHPERLRLLAYVQDDRSAIRHSWGDFYSDAQGRTVLASFSYPAYQ
jgi:hypothetical protein